MVGSQNPPQRSKGWAGWIWVELSIYRRDENSYHHANYETLSHEFQLSANGKMGQHFSSFSLENFSYMFTPVGILLLFCSGFYSTIFYLLCPFYLRSDTVQLLHSTFSPSVIKIILQCANMKNMQGTVFSIIQNRREGSEWNGCIVIRHLFSNLSQL